ncbi:pentraxin-related protein PTX3 [Sebastes fasciatus]|uniref:pentraxin-related protein PTX3 n=1 Tax=Sebastes fasciatus TaxID=394691 RepID=UPI003D9E0B35
MFRCRIPQAVSVLLACMCMIFAYEDDIDVNYSDTYYNEISDAETPEPTASPAPCNRDVTKWDKMFSMLENSQMRENMLLQYADDIIKVEMGSLRAEMLRFVAQYGGSCGVAVETTGRRMAMQLESRLKDALDRIRAIDPTSVASGNSVGNSNRLESMMQQLLSAARTQATRLTKLETSCLRSPGAGIAMTTEAEEKVTAQKVALVGVLTALEQTKVELGEVLRSLGQRYLPAGCEMALLNPMRSTQIYTSVRPERPLSVSSFTVCMWVKPTAVSNKTVLFSYGTRRNPYEIQLLLGQTSALFTIGGEAHLVEARGVVNGGKSEWIHLCGAWASDQGLASLWAGGKKVASTPGVAEGHVLPNGGFILLGQERNGCCTSTAPSGNIVEGYDSKLAFAGKMTGVNMWDRVLSEDEISQLALREGKGCEQRGNLVAWGVTEMVPHGGAQFIN